MQLKGTNILFLVMLFLIPVLIFLLKNELKKTKISSVQSYKYSSVEVGRREDTGLMRVQQDLGTLNNTLKDCNSSKIHLLITILFFFYISFPFANEL